MKKLFFVPMMLLLIVTSAFAEKFGGIEIGGKGVKIAVINIINVDEGQFKIEKDWTVNTAVTKNISHSKVLAKEDIDATASTVNTQYERLKVDFGLNAEHIFIVGSSGVALASNTNDLSDKVKSLTGELMVFIDAETEGKLVTKGGVPAKRYDNSFVWDIGGGNSKGGYVIKSGPYYDFIPVSVDYGCVTLTEKINKLYNPADFDEFRRGLRQYNMDTLRPQIIKRKFDNKPAAKRKQNFYALGGGSWMFTALMFPEKFLKGQNDENYIPFTFADVSRFYDIMTKGDVNEFLDKQAAKNPEIVEIVRNAYSDEAITVGATLLYDTMNENSYKDDKLKCYFVRNGQVAWIIAYTVDYVRKQNK